MASPTKGASHSSIESNPIYQFGKGALIGTTVVAGCSPALYVKDMWQTGNPIRWNDCWKGMGIQSMSTVPAMAIQSAANSTFLNAYSNNQPEKLTDAQKLLCGGLAGGASAFGCTTAEMVTLHKRQPGQTKNLQQIFAHIFNMGQANQSGWKGRLSALQRIFTGSVATGMREFGFSGAYNGGAPFASSFVASTMNSNPKDGEEIPLTAKVSGSILAGSFGMWVGTPGDVLRAAKQHDAIKPEGPKSYWHYATTIPLKELFKTGLLRAGIGAVAIPAIVYLNGGFEDRNKK